MTLLNEHIFWSYRLAKFEVMSERRGLGRRGFAAFESRLGEHLMDLACGAGEPPPGLSETFPSERWEVMANQNPCRQDVRQRVDLIVGRKMRGDEWNDCLLLPQQVHMPFDSRAPLPKTTPGPLPKGTSSLAGHSAA
jgi:hypothetical protein